MSATTAKVFITIWLCFIFALFFLPFLVDFFPTVIDGFTWIHGLLIALTIIFIYGVLIYNRFVLYSNSLVQSLSGIDVQLKRRSDLIPNLVQVVQGYATHEKTLLTTIATQRAQLLKAQTPSQKGEINTGLSASLKTLFAIAEQYPKLKANENFLSLQKELSSTENEIAASRRIYNENVALFNTLRESFPSNIVGSICGFSKSQHTSLS